MIKTESLLLPHQEKMIEFILANRYCALWCGMGLYKTVSTLTALRTMLATGDAERILVAAPKLVATDTWPDELDEWEHLQGIAYQRLTGPLKQRIAALESPAPIHIINHENLVWLWKHLGPKRWPYDTIVLDESSRGYKNHRRWTTPKKGSGAKRNLTRFGAAVNIRGLQINHRLIELTGTPAPNGYLDLWSQIYLLDQGKRLGYTFDAFKQCYFDENPYSFEIKPKPGAEDKIDTLVSDLVISMSEEDHLSLPERIYQNVVVKLPPKAMEQYTYMRRHFVMEHYDDVEAVNAGVLTNKLLQLANGSVYSDTGEDHAIHEAKLDALARIIEDAESENEQVLVAYSFEFDKARIKKKFPKAIILGDDPDAIRKWKTKKAGVMLCHPASAGHGLNLQAGGRLCVWYGLTWDLELYLQLNKRLHRGDQKMPVIIKHIVAEGTEDERVLPKLTEKNATQERIRNAVRFYEK